MNRSLLTVIMVLSVVAPAFAQAGEVDLGKTTVQFDEAVTDDFDGDGYEELTLYYMEGVLVASSEDTNLDGEPDFWLHYTKDWYADMEVQDRDFDGTPDEFVALDPEGKVIKVETTGTRGGGEGFVDRIIRFITVLIFLVVFSFVYQKVRGSVNYTAPNFTGVASKGSLAHPEFILRAITVTVLLLWREVLALLDHVAGFVMGTVSLLADVLKAEGAAFTKFGREKYLSKDTRKVRGTEVRGRINVSLNRIKPGEIAASFTAPIKEYTDHLDALKKSYYVRRTVERE